MTEQRSVRCLVLNGATLGPDSAGVIAAFEGATLLSRNSLSGLQAVGSMASECRALLETLDWADGPDRIIALTGPGSFTGLRASLALANGLASGFSAALRGVTCQQAFQAAHPHESVFCVTQARRNRIFVESPDGTVWAGPPDTFDLPRNGYLIGSGVSLLTLPPATECIVDDQIVPDPASILAASLTLSDENILLPFYVDAPEAKLPAAGLRSAPRS